MKKIVPFFILIAISLLSIRLVCAADTEPPKYFQNSTNNTAAGQPTLFSLNWTDNVSLSGYIFSLCNGTWTGSSCTGPGWWNGTSASMAKNWTNFENQSGNAKFIDGFEKGNFNLWSGGASSSGSGVLPVIQSAVAYDGFNSTKFALSASAGAGDSLLVDMLGKNYTRLY